MVASRRAEYATVGFGNSVATTRPVATHFSGVPTTDRLLIEPLDHEHAEGLVAALADESVGTYIGGADVTTVEAQHARIDRLALGAGPDHPDERWLNFAVRCRGDEAVIGRIEATTYVEWGEVAYVFGPATGGQGLATEAVQWLISHLSSLGVDEVWAAVHPDNHASLRLLERLGFEPESRPGRPLGSYDDGDLVVRLGRAPHPAPVSVAP